MSLPDDFLKPISGENPSGQDLRYVVYDKIKEARREEEAISSGVWSRELKKANFLLVENLATEALISKTKDLQIAAWLTEAWLVREGIPGLQNGLNLIRALLENFWETLYPQIEDGDLEMRAGPIEWVAERLGLRVRKTSLTKNKLDWFKFQESRKVGSEKDAVGDDAKMAARQAAIDENKCTTEAFDEAAQLSGIAFYEQLYLSLESSRESATALETVCNEKFGRVAPSFKSLLQAIDDLHDVIKYYYNPQDVGAEASAIPSEEPAAEAPPPRANRATGSSPARNQTVKTTRPSNREEALTHLVALSHYLQTDNPADPSGYLILRGLRWGELRSSGSDIDPQLLEAPPTQVRQQLKKLSQEEQWAEVLEQTEASFAYAWSRGWLDLQRYAARATESLGYEAVAGAIRSELRSLLSDYPGLLTISLTDDTPTANEETKEWIRSTILPPPPSDESGVLVSALPAAQLAPTSEIDKGTATYDLAQVKAKQGRIQEAIEILTKEIAQESSGRSRFTRKFQLASICLASKYEVIAQPILMELAEEIEHRKLEEWEDAATIAHPLALLFRCLSKLGGNDVEKQRIYQKLCRLDPLLALSVGK